MVKVTADDLVKDIDASPKFRERLKLIKLVCNGPNGIQTRDIALSFTSGYLIVQTDKPLYNPAQPVYVRVLAMDESMRPIKDKQLAIKLISLTNMTVGRVNFEPGKSQNGFYNGEFELPAFPDFGTWTIKAKLGGKSETYAIAPIKVREFDTFTARQSKGLQDSKSTSGRRGMCRIQNVLLPWGDRSFVMARHSSRSM
ncbi:hypothetical protein DPMN_022709 [Dreissena polymorpha]|uniref:Macroglobulin domain-containing protein n=1 Tax=Dreissena polymorpha TaxID=45954 RepID=A0A9D4NP19_DREPO|nr:hypothetical protein DPMN_022709 [Dreissena polymorpha]